MQCCVCGKEVTPGVDAEERFTGRRKAICYECLAKGHKQVIEGKADYFYGTDEGRRRLTSGKKKRRQK